MRYSFLILLLISGCTTMPCSCPEPVPCNQHAKDCIELTTEAIDITAGHVGGYMIIRNKCPVPQKNIHGDFVFMYQNNVVYTESFVDIPWLEFDQLRRIDLDFSIPHRFSYDDVIFDFRSQDA